MSPSSDTPPAALPGSVADWLLPVGEGLWAIDTAFHRDHFDAAYLLVHNGDAAFIDTGTHFAVPRLLLALAHLGLEPGAVSHVIATHVHLDHAGGVGTLMQALPRARLLVHPRGARHMADPSLLWQGASAVYGAEEMQRSYGQVLPVAADRIATSHDGQSLKLGRSRTLMLADTPGHARHHHCIWDEASGGWFTGDTFGLSYREFNTAQGEWILPTSTPVQFEPELLRGSIERLLSHGPQSMYLTHFGSVGSGPQSPGGVPRLAELLLGLLGELVALGRRHQALPAAQRHEALKAGQLDIFTRSLRAHGCTHSDAQIAELLAVDLQLNAQGMAVWLDR